MFDILSVYDFDPNCYHESETPTRGREWRERRVSTAVAPLGDFLRSGSSVTLGSGPAPSGFMERVQLRVGVGGRRTEERGSSCLFNKCWSTGRCVLSLPVMRSNPTVLLCFRAPRIGLVVKKSCCFHAAVTVRCCEQVNQFRDCCDRGVATSTSR